MTLSIRKPHRVQHSYTQSIQARPDDVFPLLCPVREADWVPGWQPDWVISESGLVEAGCVFQTPSGEEGVAPAVWVVTEHDPQTHHVEMIKVVPDVTVTELEISLKDDGQGGTRATVAYGFTSLGPAGDALLKTCTDAWYVTFMQGWEAAMNHYLSTGAMMRA